MITFPPATGFFHPLLLGVDRLSILLLGWKLKLPRAALQSQQKQRTDVEYMYVRPRAWTMILSGAWLDELYKVL